jgi:hypothetical protein
MSFMSVRGARKHLLTAAVPLAALAFASSAQALPTVSAVTGGPTLSIASPLSYSGNTYTIAAATSSTLEFTVNGSGFDLSSPTKGTGNVLQFPYTAAICSTTVPDDDYAGVYATAGGLDTSATDSWRPSNAPAPPSSYRDPGATYWANTHGAIKNAGCAGSPIPDQTLLSDSFAGTFSQHYEMDVCKDGSDYFVSGTRQGPSGPVPYLVELGSTPNLHVYSTGALGTTALSDTLEQATNVTFTGTIDPC